MKHVASLDGVRAASILLVIAGHQLPLGPSDWQLNSVAATGGMSLFFCLSGFLIATILCEDSSVKRFLIKRFLRIAPAMWLYLAVVFLVLRLPPEVYVLNGAFISNYFHAGLVAGSTSHLWSLCVEVHFYAAIAFAVALLGTRGIFLVLPLAVLVTGMRVYGDVFSNIQTHLRVDEILAGALLGLVWKRYSVSSATEQEARWRNGFLLFAVALLWLFSCHKDSGIVGFFRPYLAALIVATVLYFRVPYLTKLLEGKGAAYIARISYALYLYHPITAGGWMNVGTDVERYLFKRPVSFAMTWAAAHLSTFYWEARWQALARQWTRRDVATHV